MPVQKEIASEHLTVFRCRQFNMCPIFPIGKQMRHDRLHGGFVDTTGEKTFIPRHIS